MLLRVATLLLCCSLLPGCVPARHESPPASPSTRSPTILVSFDGLRADYLERGITPTFAALARRGVRARHLVPAFPTLTFPNHYTIATGLDPDRHGIVHNTIEDPVLGRFTMRDRGAVGDGRWWAGEPIWATAQRQGLRTATMFWIGSEAPIEGVRPDAWLPFDESFAYDARVDRVLEWLSAPEHERPALVTLYFELLDKAGHAFGPESPEVDEALRAADALLARLLRGLAMLGLDANLVVVSDHGMARISSSRVILLDEIAPLSRARYVSTGEVVTIAPLSGHERAVEAAFLREHAHMACWRKHEMPRRFRYGTHPRIPPIVCQTEVGWVATTRAERDRRLAKFPRGAHGFDPDSREMRAVFLADGPAFRDGVVLAPIEARDVYGVVAGALRIEPAPNDGDPAVARAVLAPQAQRPSEATTDR